jgi:hypothetical protein
MKSTTEEQKYLKYLSKQKSLWKAYIRREIPIPLSTTLRDPIFILGSSRSGTTILGKVLGVSPNLCRFTENDIVRKHMFCMVENPNTVEEQLPKLAKTLVRLSGIRPEERLLEKSPGHSLIAKLLADYFVDAKFVHIVRDGRDVAFSMLGHDWIVKGLRGERKLFWFGLLPEQFQHQWHELDLWERGILRWALYVSKAREISSYSDRYCEIKYEKLCQEPQLYLERVLSFLELPIFPKLKEYSAQIKPSNRSNWAEKGLKSSQLKFYERVISEFNLSDVTANVQ